MQIIGLDHILLAMPEGGKEKARLFYGMLLGLTEVKKPETFADREGCWFEGPGTVIHLGVDPQFMPAVKAHPAFRVLDLAVLEGTLRGAGFPIQVDQNLPEIRRFFATDPFGNRLEFIQAD